jgi:hypothetical protein
MSTGPANNLFDPSSTHWEAPSWLSRFVSDLHPWLNQHRQAAREGWDDYLAHLKEQLRAEADWVARRREFLRQNGVSDAQRLGSAPAAEGNVWVYDEIELPRLVDGRSIRAGLVGCWGPPEFGENNRPCPDAPPLPPPRNRVLRPEECWAALLAVHDEVRDPRERIGPDDDIDYMFLRHRVRQLTEEDLPYLQDMLRTARDSVPSASNPLSPLAVAAEVAGQHVEALTQSVHATPPAGRSKKRKPPAKRPTIPQKYKKPMKLLPKFQAIQSKVGKRWTKAGFCSWLRSEHLLSISEVEFSHWYASYTRRLRHLAGRG